jgi:tetratricopeptide (TPR) repeat protein
MAPRTDNACTTAYAGSVDVLGVRGQIPPRAGRDLRDFYAGPTLGPDALQILQRRGIGYTLLPVDSPLNAQLEHLPGFAPMDNPGDRYRMYEVTDEEAFEQTPTVIANGALNDEERDAAIEGYTEALEDNPDPFLAYLGLGIAYTEQEQYAQAAQSYEAALELDPDSPAAHEFLAKTYNATGDTDQARAEFEQAVAIAPGNTELRLRYGEFLVPLDRREAVKQHLTLVDTFPKVPEYRVKLGTVLMLAGATEAADQEFERAIRLAPNMARLRADIGGANLLAGRPETALLHYENALDLEPNSQLYALNLGRIHAQLSAQNGRDEGHFEEAEALLSSVEDLGYQPWESDQSEAARIALGDLYLEWDRPEDAAAAYEQALELNPDSQEAQEKLDGLGR